MILLQHAYHAFLDITLQEQHALNVVIHALHVMIQLLVFHALQLIIYLTTLAKFVHKIMGIAPYVMILNVLFAI